VAGTVFRGNLVRKAGVGGIAIATDPDASRHRHRHTLLEDNVAIGAADDSIHVDSSATTLTGNLAVHNGDLGIEAVAGVTDGRGTRPSGNATDSSSAPAGPCLAASAPSAS
jgi:hypothetical protein